MADFAASRYASRKFLLAAVAFAAEVVFFGLGKLNAVQWLSQSAWASTPARMTCAPRA